MLSVRMFSSYQLDFTNCLYLKCYISKVLYNSKVMKEQFLKWKKYVSEDWELNHYWYMKEEFLVIVRKDYTWRLLNIGIIIWDIVMLWENVKSCKMRIETIKEYREQGKLSTLSMNMKI